MAYSSRKFHKKKKPLAEGEVAPAPTPRAWPKEIDDLVFDSPLEYYMWQLLTQYRIAFEFKRKYTFFSSFKYGGETIMGVSLTVDFYLTDFDVILDPKGAQHNDNHLKWKLLMKMLIQKGQQPRIIFVTNKTQCQEFITSLSCGFTETVKEGTVNSRIKQLKRVSKLIGSEFFDGKGEVVCTLRQIAKMAAYDFDKLLTKLS